MNDRAPDLALDTLPSLDPATLQSLRATSRETDVAAELCEIFDEDIACQLAALRSAFERGDPARLSALAHRVKGSCETIGARRMGALSLALEWHSARGTGAAIGEVLAQLEQEFDVVRAALRAFVSGP